MFARQDSTMFTNNLRDSVQQSMSTEHLVRPFLLSLSFLFSRAGQLEAEDSKLCWSEVDCRGSRRATMNQTQHQRWVKDRWASGSYSKQQHTIKRQGSRCVEQRQRGASSGREQQLRERAKKLVCRRTSTGSHIEYKRRELFTREGNHFLYDQSQK